MREYLVTYSIGVMTRQKVMKGNSAIDVMAQLYKEIGKAADGFNIIKVKENKMN